MHVGLARREQAFWIRVTRSIWQVADHVLHDLGWRLQAKGHDVAIIQLS